MAPELWCQGSLAARTTRRVIPAKNEQETVHALHQQHEYKLFVYLIYFLKSETRMTASILKQDPNI